MKQILLLLTLAYTLFAAQTDILIVGRSHAGELDNWKTVLEGLGSVTVSITETTPSDLSMYDQVWYADFLNWTSGGQAGGTFEEPSDNAINTVLPNYLKNGGKLAFLTDHASGNPEAQQTHDQIKKFVENTTVNSGNGFKIGPGVIWRTDKVTVDIDPLFGVDDNLKAKLEDPTKDYQASMYTYVVKNNFGSGIGILKGGLTESWDTPASAQTYVGVAWVGDSFKPEFQNKGRIFVFTDIFNALKAGSGGNTEDNDQLLELIVNISGGKDVTAAPLVLDTAGVEVNSGDTVYYSNALTAGIKTHESATISYTINGGTATNVAGDTTSIDFTSLPDRVDLEVTVSGESDTIIITETTKKWTFVRVQPATLTLDTAGTDIAADSKVVYQTVGLTANITTNGDQFSYTINGGTATDVSAATGSIDLTEQPDSVEITVTASGSNVISTSKTWTFVRRLPDAAITLDTTGTNVAAGSTVNYKIVDLLANITTDADQLSYTINGGTAIDIAASTGPIDFTSLADSVEITVTASGTAFTTSSATWTFIRDLPDATLFLNTIEQYTTLSDAGQNAIVFTTPTQAIALELRDPSGAVIPVTGATEILYSTGNQTPATSFSSFEITGNDTIRAIATVEGYDNPVEGFWIFEQDLPNAQIVADSSVVAPDSVVFTTATYPVVLSVVGPDGVAIPLNDQNQIWYALNNSDPATGTLYTGDTIWLTSSDTLRATADIADFDNPEDGIWYYIQQLPGAVLEADPGSAISTTPFVYATASLEVTLTTGATDTIFYSIASKGGSESIYTDTLVGTGIVTISGDDTIWATAYGVGTNAVDTVWTYDSELPDADLTADPSDSPVYLFGHTLDVTLSSTNADAIFYAIDQAADTNSTLYTTAITIDSSSNDTVVIYGYAYGENFAPVSKSWTYVRDTLPAVAFNPEGKKFSDRLELLLSIEGGIDPEWENVRIYYTMDSTIELDETTGTLYTGSIYLDTTITVYARAYADNRVESKVISQSYVLTAAPTEAWYFDNSGDGAIDAARIVLSKAVTTLPELLTLTSPFDSTETITVSTTEMALSSDSLAIEITLDTPFAFDSATGFEPALLGTLHGAEYLDSADITIGDSVAPVILYAEYYSGKIIDVVETETIRANDTLKVVFSEDITIVDMKSPFTFYRDILPYSADMIESDVMIDGNTGIFVIDSLNGYTNPLPGDSINIDNGAGVDGNGVEQTNPNNRKVEMIVHEPPYQLLIQAVAPVNPETYLLPEEIAPEVYESSYGALILADFRMALWESTLTGIEVHVAIFDAVGHKIAETHGLNTGENLVAEIKTETRTQIAIYWNGKNENHRKVGGGSYIAMVTIIDGNGIEVQERLPLGIMWSSKTAK